MFRRLRIPPVLVTLLLTACQADGPAGPLYLETALDITDGANGGAVGGFFWLTPTVKKNRKSFSGTFDPNLLSLDLHIEICQIDGGGPAGREACVGDILRTLNASSPPEEIRVDLEAENYSSTWVSTNGSDFHAGSTYRAVVSVGLVELGWVDLEAAASRKDVKRVGPDFVGFVPGDPFVFKFRVETGIPGGVVVTPASALIEDDETQVFTATVSDLYSSPLAGATVDWTIDDAGVAILSPTSGTTDGSGQATTTATPAGALNTVATVTATSQGTDGTATLEVEPPPVPVQATDDAYPEIVVGNVSVNSANVAGGGFSVVDNDQFSGSVTITAFDATSLNGGDVTMVTSGPDVGRFTYDPPPGFEGVDQFTYTIDDGATSDEATATLTVQDVIWFVDNTAAGPGDGRLSAPFTCLVSAACFSSVADDDPGDVVFLYAGGGTYDGGLTLLDGQRLVGQGASSSLADLAGVVWPASSPTEPTTGGSSPVIVTTAAATDAVALAQDNALHGIQVGNTTGAAIVGNAFGTLRVRNVDVTGEGQALDLTDGTLDAVGGFGELSSANSPGKGVSLTDVLGGLSHTSPSSIAGAAGVAFDVDGGAGAVTYEGDITNATGRSVEVTGKTGGSARFGGAIDDDGQGVFLNGNTGAAVDFTGGLDLSTGANDAFTATGGGFVTVGNQIVTNRIVTSTGVGVRIEDTTIGADGVTFQSVSTNGATHGIFLQNTGNSGAFLVSGAGTAGSGGTIQNASVDGIGLANAHDVGLKHVTISNPSPDADAVDAATVSDLVFEGVSATAGAGRSSALRGSNVTNLTIVRSTFDGGGGSLSNVHAVVLTNLLGTSLFTAGTFRNGKDINVLIQNITRTNAPDLLTITDGTSFADSGGGDHLQIEADGSSYLRLDVHNGGGADVSFSGTGQDAIQLEGEGTGTLIADITDIAVAGQLGSAVNMATVGSGHVIGTVTGVTLTGGTTHVVNGIALGISTLEATITNNTITTGVVGSGVRLTQEGNGRVTANVAGNTISGASPSAGIASHARGGTLGLGTMDLTLSGNVVNMTDPTGLDAISIQSGSSAGGDTNTVCLNMSGNDSSVAAAGSVGYFLRNFTGATFRLQDFTGSGNSFADIVDWVNNVKNNTGSVFVSVLSPFSAAPAPCATP